MRKVYCLREVDCPEDRHLKAKFHKMPRANIFMSMDFFKPKVANNKGKHALVLI